MKNFVLILWILLPLSICGQFLSKEIPRSLSKIAVPRHSKHKPAPLKTDTLSTIPGSQVVSIIGTTYYDLQTDGSMQQKIISFEEGKMAAVWQRSVTTDYSEVGTGYNFFDGTSWGPWPVANIDNFITLHPSIARWNEQGEIVVTKQNAGPIMLMKRSMAGSGTWNYMFLDTVSAPGCDWPAVMTSGPNHEIIHILALTPPTEYGGTPYLGLNGALLYWRSSDGGSTWEKEAFQIPALTSADYYGFTPDSYAWSNPRGDTIAFVYGDNWSDEFIMYSTDSGDTWQKIVVLDNPYKGQAPGSFVPEFYCSDGSGSIALDRYGVFHVTFGRMRASEDASGRKWYPYTDGLIYWNSLLPQLQDISNLDTLAYKGNLVGWVDESIVTIDSIPFYNAGLSSYSSISLDDERDLISVFYSGVVAENPYDNMNFRHIKVTATCLADVYRFYNNFPYWQTLNYDFNNSIDDMYLEFIFPFIEKVNNSDKINYISQSTDVLGSHVLQPSIPVHDNNVIHVNEDKDIFAWWVYYCPMAVEEKDNQSFVVSNFPNPVHESTTFNIVLPNPAGVVLEVYSAEGIRVFSKDLGIISKEEKVEFNTSHLTAGIYFYTARTTTGQVKSGKMIVSG